MSDSSKAALLSTERRALIEALLLEKGIKVAPQAYGNRRPLLQKASRSGSLPLSHSQERLWFLDQMTPGSPVYNLPAALSLIGPLDAVSLEESLKEIMRRHEALRTCFTVADGEPIQVISPTVEMRLQLTDLNDLPISEREARARQLMTEEARRPFDLTRGPLMRARLLRLDEEKRLLLLTMHHIVSDGWSMGVLFRELTSLYEAFSQRRAPSLSDLPIQYADYALWQRELLQGEFLETQLAYWKKQLNGSLPWLELPTDRARPAVQSYRGAKQTLALPDDLLSKLKQRSNEQEATLFMTLLAAFKALLQRYTGQTDLIISTPIANRNRVEVEGLIGLFANTLALRTDLSGDPTFAQLVKRVKEVTLGAYDHQDLPFEKLVEELHVARDLSHQPLTQVFFALNRNPMQALELAGLTVAALDIDRGTTKFDLSLTMVETEPGLTAVLEYNTDLFDSSVIMRLLRHFEMALREVVANPQRRLSEIRLLSEGERHQLLVEWNDTHVEYPENACLHALFEAQAARNPDRVAVVFEDRQLTYAELNQQADQLAGYLRKMGVGPETLVGISIERSVELVVGLLGILKAGGAYVPIDPESPPERLAFILEDAGVPALLIGRKSIEKLPPHTASVVCLDSDWSKIEREGKVNLSRECAPGNAAYMIYTSGSTGRPKGAINTHQGICNRLLWMQDAYQLGESDRVLQKTPFSFDVSVWEFFWPLIVGARLILARPEGHRDSSYLIDLIENQRITVAHFVPSMLQIFLEDPGLERCSSLKHVICSGEALPVETQRRFLASIDADLHNLYGPTEASVDVTFWACDRQSESRVVPIGRPIANTKIYLLDNHLNPVVVGAPGELHIGGVGLARGYHRRADLTAEKFIPDPFSDDPGSRLYRTGDLARFGPDGNIEFLGRLDHQVKIRGFRIELGEIETALGEIAAVRERVVVAHDDPRGEKRLVAYLVPDGELGVTLDELRERLKARLPEYMVPSAFVTLDRMPLLSNGKLDRHALPRPEPGGARPKVDYVAPRTELEQTIAGVWQDRLQVERVDVNDNFFDLGGSSLLLARVRIDLQTALSREISMVDMFRYPTVRSLAVYLSAAQNPETSFESSADRAVNRREGMHRQRRLRLNR